MALSKPSAQQALCPPATSRQVLELLVAPKPDAVWVPISCLSEGLADLMLPGDGRPVVLVAFWDVHDLWNLQL